MKTVKEIINFLNKNNISLDSIGCYRLPDNIAIMAIEKFINTGKSNLIKKHQEWTFGNWDLNDSWKIEHFEDYFTLKELLRLKNLKKFWNDKYKLDLLNELIKRLKIKEEIKKTYKYKRKNEFTSLIKNKCKERDFNKCVKCGSTSLLEIDHIMELIDGGDNSLKNLQTLCRKCHRIKTNKEIKIRQCKS